MKKAPAQTSITKAIWDGKIPVRFSLDSSEAEAIRGGKDLQPYFIEIFRCSYLTLYTSQIRKYFVEQGLDFIGDDADIWYESEGIPLKWHYPIGLLYDMRSHLRPNSSREAVEPPLPWDVCVRFRNFPTDKLIRTQIVDGMHDFFMSMAKESDFLRNGSTKKIMNLSKNDQKQLWDGLCSYDYDRFWAVHTRLVSIEPTPPKHIPLRIYLPENTPVIQEPVTPMDDQGNQQTLGDVLRSLLPDLFPHKITSNEAVALPVIHGVVPRLEVPLLWAAQNLVYPDGFLHVVIVFCR